MLDSSSHENTGADLERRGALESESLRVCELNVDFVPSQAKHGWGGGGRSHHDLAHTLVWTHTNVRRSWQILRPNAAKLISITRVSGNEY